MAASRDGWRGEHLPVLGAGLRGAEPGSDAQVVWARALVRATSSCAGGVVVVQGLLDGLLGLDGSGTAGSSGADGSRTAGVPAGLEVDQDLRWSALTSLAAQGVVGEDELAAEAARDQTMSGRAAHLRALAARPTKEAKAAAWTALTQDQGVTNDHLRALVVGFREPSGAAEVAAYADSYYASIEQWWEQRSMVMASILVGGLFPGGDLAEGQVGDLAEGQVSDLAEGQVSDLGHAVKSHPSVVAARTWLAERPEAPRALRRIVIEQCDHLERALAMQARSMEARAMEAASG